MRYAQARIREKQREETCRFYICECLRMMCENTAQSVAGQYMTVKISDILISPGKAHNETTEPGEARAHLLAKFRGGEGN